MKTKIKMINDNDNMSSIDIKVIRAVFIYLFIYFLYKKNFKHLKHKQKASK